MIIKMETAIKWLKNGDARLSGYTNGIDNEHSHAIVDHFDRMQTYHCLDDDMQLAHTFHPELMSE